MARRDLRVGMAKEEEKKRTEKKREEKKNLFKFDTCGWEGNHLPNRVNETKTVPLKQVWSIGNMSYVSPILCIDQVKLFSFISFAPTLSHVLGLLNLYIEWKLDGKKNVKCYIEPYFDIDILKFNFL